jgi:hypothetical protein
VRIRLLLLLHGVFVFVLISSTASAIDVTGQSRTYLMSRETVDSSKLMPLTEYLNFKVDNSARDSVSFNFGGWYRYDLQSESASGRDNDDLQYAYLSIKKRSSNALLDLGRVLVHEGLASEQIDGIHARTDLKGGLTVAAYGGSPVETSSDTRRGDSIAGGRIAQGQPGYYNIGISHLDEKNNRSSIRREEGVDIWLRPLTTLEVQGLSSYNSIGRGWMQHSYYMTVGPFAGLRLNGEFSKVNYKQFFTSMNVSAFAFPNIDPNETVTTTGGSIDYAITRELTAVAEYKNFHYTIAGEANYYGGKIAFAGESLGLGAGGHRMDGATSAHQYDELEIYVSRKIARADISLQLVHLAYKQEINGIKHADDASAAAGYAITPKTRIVGDVSYITDSDFKRDVRAMATLVYSFDAHYESAKNNTSSAIKKSKKGNQ